MNIMSTNFAKTLVWKHEYDVFSVTSQTAHTKYKWPPYAAERTPPMKIFCVRHCFPLSFWLLIYRLYFTIQPGLPRMLLQAFWWPPFCRPYWWITHRAPLPSHRFLSIAVVGERRADLILGPLADPFAIDSW